jgi:hypothetical protein
MTADHDRNIVVFYLTPPVSLGKSAQMLTFKYLRRLGWDPTVVTVANPEYPRERIVDWCGVEVVTVDPTGSGLWRLSRSMYRARSRSWKRTISSSHAQGKLSRMAQGWQNYALFPFTAALSFPDRYRHAASALLAEARRLHGEKNFQAVLSIYDPVTAHQVASRFARQEKLPWIALTKDYYSKPRQAGDSLMGRAANWAKGRYESSVLSRSSALLPVFDDMVGHYQMLVPGVKIRTLTHCYDDDDFTGGDYAPPESPPVFRVVSIGEVYEKHDRHALGVFFLAVGQLVNEGVIDGESFRVRFVGGGGERARAYAQGSGAENLLETIPRVTHEEAMRELRRATCLLFTQVPAGSRRRLPEYLAGRRPILAFPEIDGAMSQRVLHQYGAAAVVPAALPEIKAILTRWYRRFQDEGQFQLPVNEEVVRSFSASSVARGLGAVLEGAMGEAARHQVARLMPSR